jgi:hypothetical protein
VAFVVLGGFSNNFQPDGTGGEKELIKETPPYGKLKKRDQVKFLGGCFV